MQNRLMANDKFLRFRVSAFLRFGGYQLPSCLRAPVLSWLRRSVASGLLWLQRVLCRDGVIQCIEQGLDALLLRGGRGRLCVISGDLDSDGVGSVGGGDLAVPPTGAGGSSVIVNVEVGFIEIGAGGKRHAWASHRRAFHDLDRSPSGGLDRHVVQDKRSSGGEKLFVGQCGSGNRGSRIDPGQQRCRPGHGPGKTSQRLVHPPSLVHGVRAERAGRFIRRKGTGRNADPTNPCPIIGAERRNPFANPHARQSIPGWGRMRLRLSPKRPIKQPLASGRIVL